MPASLFDDAETPVILPCETMESYENYILRLNTRRTFGEKSLNAVVLLPEDEYDGAKE